MSDNNEVMGTSTEARTSLITKAKEWRRLRQPIMATAKELRERDLQEREIRFQLANAALLWLWHEEHEPCHYCGNGKITGLPGNACENCMNTGFAHPELLDEH